MTKEYSSDFMESLTADVRAFVRNLRVRRPTESAVPLGARHWPRVSIVVPSYNQAEFIERTLLSIINQGYQNLELIVIDGGSNDGTLGILRRYREHISYWVSEKDRGQSEALNKGFAQATGDIYGWMNADDLYAPEALTTAVEVFKKNKSAQVVFGDWLEVDREDKVLVYNYAFDFRRRHMAYEGFHLNAQASFWRMQLHADFGTFDESLHRTMDYDMLLRFGILLGDRGFVRVACPMACFRRHPDQKTQGFDAVVANEHRYIATKLGLKKFAVSGKFMRLAYRWRRAFWYAKRGGLRYLWKKIQEATVLRLRTYL
jgi:glycosyltransferase involved in cell wall biosynthesis